ncbi:MAG: cache domain-containing protein [Burkholderiales bacterium]|nr:cache domain-containing protein [Burkholderiales bacterium]
MTKEEKMAQLLRYFMLGLCIFLFQSQVCLAAEESTPEQAKAMVKKAIAYYSANGREKTMAMVNDTNGMFNERDLYIVMYDLTGTVIAHGANKKLVGKNIIELRDVNGVLIMQEHLAAAKGKNDGWVNYKWPHPKKNELGNKSMYNEIVDDVMFACGIYR